MKEAAGTLMNVEIGKEIPIFYNELLKGDTLFLEKKLRMLLNGEYKGIPLLSHQEGWKMSRKRMRKLWMKYQQVFDKYKYMF